MHDFNYRHNNLYCESVNIEGLARKYGTPLYVYSRNTIISHYKKIKENENGFNNGSEAME